VQKVCSRTTEAFLGADEYKALTLIKFSFKVMALRVSVPRAEV